MNSWYPSYVDKRQEWLETGRSNATADHIKVCSNAADEIAGYDRKLASLVRAIAQAYSDLRFYAEDVKRNGNG